MHSRDFFALASPAPGCSGESEGPITRKVPTVNLLKSSSYGHHTESTSTSDNQGAVGEQEESIVTSPGVPRRDLNHTPRDTHSRALVPAETRVVPAGQRVLSTCRSAATLDRAAGAKIHCIERFYAN